MNLESDMSSHHLAKLSVGSKSHYLPKWIRFWYKVLETEISPGAINTQFEIDNKVQVYFPEHMTYKDGEVMVTVRDAYV